MTEFKEWTTDLDRLPGQFDAIVIGAGVAGGFSSLLLARDGMRVLLVERASFPRYKVCGCCLNQRSQEHLKAAGLADRLGACGAVPLSQARIGAGRYTASIALPGGIAVTRSRLDAILAGAAVESGAAFLMRTTAALGPATTSSRRVLLKQGNQQRSVEARVVLAAGGLADNALNDIGEGQTAVSRHSRVGIGAVLPEAPALIEPGTIFMACGRDGYAGFVRVEENKVAIAAAVNPASLREAGGPAGVVRAILGESPLFPPPDLESLTWKGTPPLTRQATRLAARRVLVLGDAGGYVEPFTGEGMAWALDAAARAAEVLRTSGYDNWPANAQAWETAQRSAMRRQRMLCHAMARMLRSPRATRLIVGALARNEGLSRPFVRLVNAQNRS